MRRSVSKFQVTKELLSLNTGTLRASSGLKHFDANCSRLHVEVELVALRQVAPLGVAQTKYDMLPVPNRALDACTFCRSATKPTSLLKFLRTDCGHKPSETALEFKIGDFMEFGIGNSEFFQC